MAVFGQVQQAFTSNYKELQCVQQLLQYVQNLKWTTKAITPQYHDMRRTADLVYDKIGDYLYLRKIDSQPCIIYSYQVSTNQWQLGASCPPSCYRFSMAYHNHLMVIGGAETRANKATRTGKILSFVDGKWKQLHPDMPTSRSRSTAIICRVDQAVLLIVIGGEDDSDAPLKTVEVLDLTNPSTGWRRAGETPETLCSSSGVEAGGYIYVLGGWSKRNVPSSAAFRCSIDTLMKSTQPKFNAPNIWEVLPELPAEETTVTSFRNAVIVVGGRANSVAVHDIRTYKPDSERWEVIGYLPNPRYICFAIGLPDKLIVLGGKRDTTTKENTIEILAQ